MSHNRVDRAKILDTKLGFILAGSLSYTTLVKSDTLSDASTAAVYGPEIIHGTCLVYIGSQLLKQGNKDDDGYCS